MVTVAFFSSHPYHRKTVSRVDELRSDGVTVYLAAFTRTSFQTDSIRSDNYFDIGPSTDGKYLQRLLRLPQYVWRSVRIARSFKECDVIWANTLDTLFLALVARPFISGRRSVIYDVADLTGLQLAGHPASRLLRSIEKMMCRAISGLIVNSPWYYWTYYWGRLGVEAPAYLLENKVSAPLPARSSIGGQVPWRILWHGSLRCASSFSTLVQLATTLPDLVEIHCWGSADTIGERLRDRSLRPTNIKYHGVYDDAEIEAIFEGIHFVFAFDIDDGENSKMLLPNRLYHGVARGIPVIAVGDSAIGNVVQEHLAGATFDSPLSANLISYFKNLSPATYLALQGGISDKLRGAAVYTGDVTRLLRCFTGDATIPALPADESIAVVLAGPPSEF